MEEEQADAPLLPQINHDDIIAVGLERVPGESRCYKATAITVWGAFSIITAIPTAFLNFLASLNIPLDELKSFKDLEELMSSKSGLQITNATWSAVCSEVPNAVINFVYLGPALNKVKNIFFKAINAGRARFCGTELPPNAEKLDTIDVLACVWGFWTSLAFAQIAGDTFSLLGGWRYIPFSLNGLSYFATRFNGVESFLRGLFDKNQKFKTSILEELCRLKEKEGRKLTIEVYDGNVEQALLNFLSELFTDLNRRNPIYFEKSTLLDRLNFAARLIGWPAAIILALSIWPPVTQDNIRGIGSLTHTNFGKPNYQGAGALTAGYTSSAPTPFFYGRAILNAPLEMIKLGQNLYDRISRKEYVKFAGWAGLAALLLYMSYASGKGWADVAQTAIDNDYLSYLGLTKGSVFGKIFPNLTATAASAVNGSVSLKFINKQMSSRDTIDSVDLETAVFLLEYGSPNLTSLQDHPFFQPQICCAALIERCGLRRRPPRPEERNANFRYEEDEENDRGLLRR